MYKIEFTKRAVKQLKNIDKQDADKLLHKIKVLSKDPRSKILDIKKIKLLKDAYRLRVNDYRIIYEIQDKKLVIVIFKIATRGKAYV